MEFAYYNGCYGRSEEIKIPLTDRSIYFGDGVYDAMIGRNGKIYEESEHLNRLYGNAQKLGIKIEENQSIISKLLYSIIKKTGLCEYFIYIQISRNFNGRTHSYPDNAGYNLLITVKDYRLPPIDKRLSLIGYEDKRHLMCDIKSLNLLGSVSAARYAEERGYDEAVFHRGDTVTECSRSNIAIIKDGCLYTHPANNNILSGITRRHILKICEKLEIKYTEVPFSLRELCEADEVLVSSTSKLCLSASEFCGNVFKITENSIGTQIIYNLRKDFMDSLA